MVIEALCRRYPAYTPETAAAAPAWLLRHMEILTLAGVDQSQTPAQAPPKTVTAAQPPRPRTQAETERMLFG